MNTALGRPCQHDIRISTVNHPRRITNSMRASRTGSGWADVRPLQDPTAW